MLFPWYEAEGRKTEAAQKGPNAGCGFLGLCTAFCRYLCVAYRINELSVGGVLQSLFVLQYARGYHDRSYKIPAAGAALLGLLAGWSTETGAGAALMLSARPGKIRLLFFIEKTGNV